MTKPPTIVWPLQMPDLQGSGDVDGLEAVGWRESGSRLEEWVGQTEMSRALL